MDQTGAAANVKRHDYLPFGEELFAGAGGRTAAMGYAAGDGVRPQFTQKERDIETGLDYFNARYYSSIQGRFTGVDSGPFAVADPQNFNRDYKTLNQADAKLGSTLLGHVLDEYQQAATTFKGLTGKDQFDQSHASAVAFESKVLSDYTKVSEKPRHEINIRGISTVGFQYTSIQYDIQRKSDSGPGAQVIQNVRITQRRRP